MVIIKVIDQIGRCYSNTDGMMLKQLLLPELQQNKSVTVDFTDIGGTTSSFVNTAFIELLDHFDFAFIKAHLKFINSNSQINNMIKSRFLSEVERRQELVLN
ncbi:STAS-like domain-containing protein [Bacillus badius]|uniref:DUF4325 domain-containing protein n=1 Tax=Bacillus badius TaxID=1455 RepID=A0ABR5ANQ3_BACBA|nr:STAS-like domain-containing protein [Bacillus badius]KIL72505.1 hypothetical protein SD77_3478 [Bacillus badius]MED4718284.1 STAS-like domain-containing protein [Bacillus badius]